MKNFRYHVGDESYVLSTAEHSHILKLIGDGKSGLAVLREGRLVMNLAFIRSVHETDDLTKEQERTRIAAMQLPEGRGDVSPQFLENTKNDLFKRRGWAS